MKMVIEIDDEHYERIMRLEEDVTVYPTTLVLYEAVKNGKPLPEHHGRLIDENELIDEIVCEEIDGRYYDVIYAHSIYDAPTIIEGSDS